MFRRHVIVIVIGLLAGQTVRAQAPARSDSAFRPSGFWMAAGAGIGGLGCDCRTDGGGREIALVTNLALGGAVNSRVVAGGEGIYWVRSYGGHTLTYLALDAFLLFYPRPPYGFFLKGGVGLHQILTDLDHFRATDRGGVGLSVGAGYDIRLNSALALTPYVSFSRGSLQDTAASVIAFGTRLTLY